jgi:hypothetical protein
VIIRRVRLSFTSTSPFRRSYVRMHPSTDDTMISVRV